MRKPSNRAYVVEVDLDDVQPMEGQPRIHFDPGEMDALAESLGVSQEQPIIICQKPEVTQKPHYQLNDGERRWRGAQKEGMQTLLAIVVPWEDPGTRFEKAFRANLGVPLSPYEKMLSCVRLKEFKGYTTTELARRTSIKPSTVVLYLGIAAGLHPDVLKMMSPERLASDRLRLLVARELSKLQHEDQLRLAPEMLGMNEQRARALVRTDHRLRGNVWSPSIGSTKGR
ncbi:MAG: ParB/RepB/Spo0J family partition protein, partial [Patescibacteria group bacterium]